MADNTVAPTASEFEFEVTAGREEIANVLHGVVDGVLAGSVRLGVCADAVSVGVPDELSLEIEFEDNAGEMSLELELEWPTPSEKPTTPVIEHRSGGASETITLVGAADGAESVGRFEVFSDRGEEWRWRLRHRNGNIIAISGEGYTQKHNAKKGLRSVIENASTAELTEPSGN